MDASISYDEQGNFYAYSTRDCVAGQPLRICYGGKCILFRFCVLSSSAAP